MSGKWQVLSLGETCEVLDSRRKPVTKRDRVAGEHPYYGATGILDYVADYIFDEAIVLVGEDGAKWGSGEDTAFAVEGKCWVNNHAHVLRPNREVLLDSWLIYYLNDSVLYGFVSGLTVPKLNQGNLREIPLPLPSVPEQKRIVGILEEALKGIATAKVNAEKNLQNAESLFGLCFAALARKFDQGAWIRTTVADIALPTKGSIRTGPFGSQLLHGEFVEEGIAVLGIDNAVRNEFQWSRRRYITTGKFKQLSRYRVAPGDVLITIMGTCGRCAVVPDDIPVAINSKHLCCITLDRRKCLPQFLHTYFLHHPTARRFLDERAKGSVMAGLNMGIIQELPVLLPTLDHQKAIIAALESVRTETRCLESLYQQKLAALHELKKSLLHQAFSGNL